MVFIEVTYVGQDKYSHTQIYSHTEEEGKRPKEYRKGLRKPDKEESTHYHKRKKEKGRNGLVWGNQCPQQ